MQICKSLVLSAVLGAGLLWSQLPATTKIAVVNLQTVLDGYSDGKKRMDDLRKLSDEYNQKIEEILKEWEKLREQHKQLTAERSVFKAGSTDHLRMTAQLERIARTAEAIENEAAAMKRAYGGDLEKRKAELLVQVHSEIKEKVAAIARNLKIDVVLRAGEDAAEDSVEQKARSLMLRQVVYHDKNVDITRDVITLLNAPVQK
jgi:Skp family chaperone for outer membrane proteins